MAVVYYQLFIIGTIVAAYLGVDHVRRWTGKHRLRPIDAAALAGAGWSLFTLTHVFMIPLMAVQMLTIWGTVGVLWHFRRQGDDLDRMRHRFSALEPELVERVARVALSQPLQTIRGRAHERELRRALEEARESVVILSGWVNDT